MKYNEPLSLKLTYPVPSGISSISSKILTVLTSPYYSKNLPNSISVVFKLRSFTYIEVGLY